MKCHHVFRPAGNASRCGHCGEYEALGPASDTPEVLIEIRAAELSNLATSHATSSESQGWIDHARDRDCANVPRDQWEAGWLGRVIHEHPRGEGIPLALDGDMSLPQKPMRYPDYVPEDPDKFESLMKSFGACQSVQALRTCVTIYTLDMSYPRQDIVVAMGRVEADNHWTL